jgi:hypothetical protein
MCTRILAAAGASIYPRSRTLPVHRAHWPDARAIQKRVRNAPVRVCPGGRVACNSLPAQERVRAGASLRNLVLDLQGVLTTPQDNLYNESWYVYQLSMWSKAPAKDCSAQAFAPSYQILLKDQPHHLPEPYS